MSVLKDPSDKNGPSQYGAFALLATIPALLLAGPAVGFFVGQWADGKLGSEPYLAISGVLLGLGAAGVEIANLVKKSQAMEKEEDDQ